MNKFFFGLAAFFMASPLVVALSKATHVQTAEIVVDGQKMLIAYNTHLKWVQPAQRGLFDLPMKANSEPLFGGRIFGNGEIKVEYCWIAYRAANCALIPADNRSSKIWKAASEVWPHNS